MHAEQCAKRWCSHHCSLRASSQTSWCRGSFPYRLKTAIPQQREHDVSRAGRVSHQLSARFFLLTLSVGKPCTPYWPHSCLFNASSQSTAATLAMPCRAGHGMHDHVTLHYPKQRDLVASQQPHLQVLGDLCIDGGKLLAVPTPRGKELHYTGQVASHDLGCERLFCYKFHGP